MKDKLVALLAVLLMVSKDVVSEKLGDLTDADWKEDGIKELIDKYGTDHEIFTKEDHERLLENNGAEYVKTLAEGSGDIPAALHGRVVGEIREQEETKLKEKYNYEGEFRGLADLMDKIVAKEKEGAVGNDPDADETLKRLNTDLETKVTELKKLVLDNDVKYKEDLETAKTASDTDIITRDKQAGVDSLNLEVEDDGEAEARELILNNFNGKYKVVREDGKTVVLDAEGKRVNNTVGDPMSVSEVVKASVPSFIKMQDGPGGGRGTGSSGDNDDGSPKITNMKEYNAHREKQSVQVNTPEDAELMKKVRESNPDFNPHEK